ncbi:MAG: UDP-3-O-acyl-N-acetylglucosamine deacetylase [Bacteroidota bacterium]
MPSYQKTLIRSCSFSGHGLHSGEAVKMKISPAPPDHGIVFQRQDLPEKPLIKADLAHVVSTTRGTIIGNAHIEIMTVEHLMATFYALGITNALVSINAKEVPIMDGSAQEFADKLSRNVKEQDRFQTLYTIAKPLKLIFHDSSLTIKPSQNFRLTVTIDFEGTILPRTARLNHFADFTEHFAPARTFCFDDELIALKKQGLIKGGNADNAIVFARSSSENDKQKRSFAIDEKESIASEQYGVLNTSLRFKNEAARHKLLDFLGDIGLFNFPIAAEMEVFRPGHEVNIHFAKQLKKLLIPNDHASLATSEFIS